MQLLEVSGRVRLIYKSLGVKGLNYIYFGATALIGPGPPHSRDF